MVNDTLFYLIQKFRPIEEFDRDWNHGIIKPEHLNELNDFDFKLCSPLYYALYKRHFSAFDWLIEKGADVSMEKNNQTNLLFVLIEKTFYHTHDYPTVVNSLRLLMKHGGMPLLNMRNSEGKSALSKAIYLFPVFDCLVELGADWTVSLTRLFNYCTIYDELAEFGKQRMEKCMLMAPVFPPLPQAYFAAKQYKLRERCERMHQLNTILIGKFKSTKCLFQRLPNDVLAIVAGYLSVTLTYETGDT